MANPEKNRKVYAELCGELDSIARGDSPKSLESAVSKVYISCLGGHCNGDCKANSDYAANTLNQIQRYCALLAKRQSVDISGGVREIATEEDALSAFKCAHGIADSLIVPHFRRKTDFSNKVFNDLYNLGLSYVEAITNGVASEYISSDDVFNAKVEAVHLAKDGVRLGKFYRENQEFKPAFREHLFGLGAHLIKARADLMRSFEMVSTTQKKITRKEEAIENLVKEITAKDDNGELIYRPHLIFPVAHGGTELGIALSCAYQDEGHTPITYPLMFSMKTRKQRVPWVEHDMPFLAKSLEGKNIVITEDWVTTGNTVRGIVNQLEGSFPQEIRIATLKRDPEKSKVPILDKYHFYIGEMAIYPGSKTDALPGASGSGENK